MTMRRIDFRGAKRALSISIVAATMAFGLTSCKGEVSGGSGCVGFANATVIEFSADEINGFDDFSSLGTAFGVAVDESAPEAGLAIALRFPSATLERRFQPTCDAAAAIDGYDFGQLNNITTPIATAYSFLTDGLTDSAGASAMGQDMTALLFIDDEDGVRQFLAVDGEITLTRSLGGSSEAEVVGDLTFVELDGASDEAELLVDGAVVRISDIDMTWDTVTQPDS